MRMSSENGFLPVSPTSPIPIAFSTGFNSLMEARMGRKLASIICFPNKQHPKPGAGSSVILKRVLCDLWRSACLR
ncbi:hypothetical protein CPSG_09695 [Coccidioides posadasii str. Silveira]|uniref:Uncharacterized protein n=1 Tax=Coccidioides posadasii (strain RMSCC 757 / Silveira) TaxID=443226 RepID=E9DIQ2_COCPS|nr:hypothetical protein CPSG_09695 [Coccidioides posadasii str. Silveira]